MTKVIRRDVDESGRSHDIDMRSRVEKLKSQLEKPALGSDQAAFSSAGSEVSQMTGDTEVRMDKVAGIQAALAAGTYKVSATAVASRVVDSILGS
jgi:flagellar biosynthesis anti-sigma factor FlgM